MACSNCADPKYPCDDCLGKMSEQELWDEWKKQVKPE